MLLTTGGGLVGGDRLDVQVDGAGRARGAWSPPQAAEKVYRSLGRRLPGRRRICAVEAGGWLEWLPQETILFDGARLDAADA